VLTHCIIFCHIN